MTAKDSKSTPKKAEGATLLERLDTRIRELQEYRGIYTQAVQQTELVYQDQGLLEDQLDDQARDYIALLSEVRDEITALRAQAEAEASRERTYRLALLGLQRQDTGCWCYTLTGGHAPECLQARAALAQAGGEG